MEVMNKKLSESDTTNRRLEFPSGSLWAFPMPDGRNSVEFVASDIHEQQWRFKVSVRNEGREGTEWIGKIKSHTPYIFVGSSTLQQRHDTASSSSTSQAHPLPGL
ncbi:hypothetical protein OIU74_006858 [Salix koriyanagi]|uniref:Uncharacterized protein n=1 Tax=Salix koriyanagi TaxID=2511006 RepID=A0A9Q0UFI6_9ROSI|nr:hypothetical protein OIU74_006858 [Salix koriyanagi]